MRVFIHAYAAGNLGDDLLVRILCERYPKTRFLLWADPSYQVRYADLKNIRVISPDSRLVRCLDAAVRRVRNCENGAWKLLLKISSATVHIGGSVFVQHEADFHRAYELDCRLRRLSRRLYVVGANFGPYTDESYYRMYRELFQSYDGICFRDLYSKHLFEGLPNVRYAPDVAFQYRQGRPCEEKKQVLISVIYMESRGGMYGISQYAEGYYHLLARLAEAWIRKGFTVKFISFCRFQEDEKAIDIIRNRMGVEYREAVSTYAYDTDVEECARQFYESEIVVGTRFHSIILGWLAKKKVLPIVYDRKTLHVLEDLKQKEYILLDGGLDQIDAEEAAEKLRNATEENVMDIQELRQMAETQFSDLDKLLL